MLRSIVKSSLRFRFLVIAAAMAMMYFGIKQIQDMPVDVFPEFAPPIVEVQTICLGLESSDVEALVTVPLEQAFNGIPGLDILRSKSVSQLSAIRMIFEPGTDLMRARQMVSEKMGAATPTLPTWAAPPLMLQPLSATSRCMKIGISSDSLSVIDLSMLTYWKLNDAILAVPGVANVAIWGERIRLQAVEVVPERMIEYGVTLDEVMEATADALDAGLLFYSPGAMIGTGGWIETDDRRLGIRNILPINKPEDLGKVVVGTRNGVKVRLSDVAEVVEDHQQMAGDAIINDSIGLMLIVEKLPWGNTKDITEGVETALAKLAPGLPGVDIDTEIFRPATYIDMSVDNLSEALLIACVLVIVILFVFLFEWRVTLISAVAIPLSLMAGALVLYLQGATINTMILAGFVIALGAVVDDAIIDVENIMRRLRLARAEGSTASTFRIILDASIEVRGAIIFATLIEVVALLPVFFMKGLSGAFFQPLAMSYAIAILASLIVALTVTPAMSYILLRNAPLHKREPALLRWMHRVYNSVLAGIIEKPRRAYVVVGITVLAGLLVLPQLGQSLLPSFKERDFLMHWVTKPGTSWPEMNRITIQGSKELRSIEGVRNFGAHIGQAFYMDEVVGINFGENWISVSPDVDYDETLNKIQTLVDGYPGLYRDVLTYLKERIREVLTGTSESIVIRLYGPELEVLRSKAREVRDNLKGIEGLIDLHVELNEEIPQVQVRVDLEKAKKYGLKPGDVRRAASTLVAGEEVGDIFREGKAYDVNVWSVPEARASFTDIENLLIDVPGGGHVRMKDVADITIQPTPNVIKRENLARRLDVAANVRGRDLGAVQADVEAALAKVSFPHEYHPEVLGEHVERQKVKRGMYMFVLLSLLGIFLLLHTSFKSTRLAMLSFLCLPMALVGGVLAAYFGSGIISLGSIVGFLTILGIAARNGIMMINHFQHLETEEGMAFGRELVLRGAQERLAPILMTAATTGLALVPLVWAGNVPGHEIELPMAIVILGGLVTSTLLNLLVIPSLYLRFAAADHHRQGEMIQ
ncbi:MAG: efflux RND transporter permease subunit [Lewinellaceae bacterium]|nr:efflux RND transporter permease subunit [Phaeodactylibacter sp.]MCB9348227.1 efflux RND transporter permease subunit [Lewinellaceae bacterium]